MRILSETVVEDDDPEEARTALRMVRDRVAFLERVLLDLLRFDEVARRPAPTARVRLAEAVESALARVAVEFPGAVEADVGALPEVEGNADLLVDAFAEIFRNAAVHAPGAVVVRGRVQDGAAVLTFDDRGPGVPVDRREDAFHLFQRLAPGTPGTGVGLAIVRRIAARHDGDVRLESAPGGGTRVRVRLPVAGPAPRAPEPEPPRARTF